MTRLIASCLVVGLLFVTAAFAVPEAKGPATAAGLVSAIDLNAKSVTVKVDDPRGEARDLTFVLTDTSKLIKGGKAISLNDLAQGDKVTVTYRAEGGKNVVVNIGVQSNM